jgi:hypothetical protein
LRKSIEPRFVKFRGADPLGFVISMNLKRRHLDESQRAMAASKIATLRDGQRSDQVEGSSIETASRLLNVGPASVKRARYVQDHGAPDLVHAVEQGDVAVSAAAAFAKSNPPSKQTRLIEKAGSVADAVKKSADVKAAADRAEGIAKANAMAKRSGAPPPDKPEYLRQSRSAIALAEFKFAVGHLFSKMDDDAKREAVEYVIAEVPNANDEDLSPRQARMN